MSALPKQLSIAQNMPCRVPLRLRPSPTQYTHGFPGRSKDVPASYSTTFPNPWSAVMLTDLKQLSDPVSCAPCVSTSSLRSNFKGRGQSPQVCERLANVTQVRTETAFYGLVSALVSALAVARVLG
jgi:hypothetical protein